ncbi:MAG: hypothetical protein K9G49_08720 [Taibaiella sp.]|nr:hypothetical protein [Taibaiella sp.]
MKNLITYIIIVVAAAFYTQKAAAQTSIDSIKKVQIKVKNLHCNNDMPTIKKRLINQDGIDEVTFTDISSGTSVFTVTYHSSITNQELIEKNIESTPGCDNKDETPYKVKRENTRKKDRL